MKRIAAAGFSGLVGVSTLLAPAAPVLAAGSTPPACAAIDLARAMTDAEIKACMMHIVLMERQSRNITIVMGTGGNITGAAGAKGDPGKAGAMGATGPAGLAGADGEKGDTGDTGPKGDTGATGPKGDTGADGPKGDTGADGPKGDKGDTGPKGDDAEPT